MAADPRIADLVQAGAIRVALFLPQYSREAATGALRGVGMGFVAIEIGRVLAERSGLGLRLIEYPTPSAAIAGLKAGACDLACLGITASRSAELDFSPAIVQFDYTLLLPGGSPIQTFAAIDRPGMRIAVLLNHASTSALARKVSHAELVGSELPDAAFALLRAGRVDAFAAPREQLLDYATLLPGSRVLGEGYGINNVGIAVPKGRPERLAYLTEFAEHAKAAGLIAAIIARGHLYDFRVAPAAEARATL